MEILFRDQYLVAVHKPAGLLVHRSPIDRHETRFALQEVRDLLGRRVYPVHRLDKPTSGVLVFALDPATARSLGDAFAGGRVNKTYLAVTRGIVPPEGIIDHSLSEEPDRLDGAKSSPAAPQPAVTVFRRLAEAELPVVTGRYASSRYSLAELTPHTGRRHQLRRHMKHIFHPIIGDTTYGEGRHNRFFREEFGCGRLLLHAAELSLPHPASGETLTIAAPPDRELARLLDRLGWLAAATGRGRPGMPAPP
ncbi:tRNA pseudouridine(65) synthase TruC [Geobacter sulfurreducens]|uniref:tRNA pseudouridine synthase C n=1 Tax=Geobacter sulfurreducens (strain ATCC 51573 / DSM 12127 / PCA) TaxID=243231 RepID=Q747V5_GEOSL|nr:tRNA pseudouridine 65 synthase [Geobacter sulfurreducens PCA]ADI85911.2 tRNA pseudouridine 65 synthase [Geobacter sulfurreducens KN400]AJY71877.1 pseudouridylate synthase [Geobacter sulfurreducens]QVW34952.1 tRNA pseudouridine(65) synthase TruC [Geobacter sulfurreducens]UAC05869.1 tRNA pseudouridine(65) synthase TruC [Geobacter sulfurreducens]